MQKNQLLQTTVLPSWHHPPRKGRGCAPPNGKETRPHIGRQAPHRARLARVPQKPAPFTRRSHPKTSIRQTGKTHHFSLQNRRGFSQKKGGPGSAGTTSSTLALLQPVFTALILPRPKVGALTQYKNFPGRTHYTLGQDGWEEVADYALTWAESHAGKRAAVSAS